MKKLLIVLAFCLLASGIAHAEDIVYGCTDANANNYNVLATDDDGTCTYPSNSDPLRVEQPWKLNGYQTPVAKPGAVISDGHGITDMCPVWYHGCFDITGTEWYKNQMRETARQIKDLGWAWRYPLFNGWY